MIGFVIVLSASLFSQSPPTPSVASPSPKAEADTAEARALAEYNQLREKTLETAAAQWKLAAWCEQAGLKPEAYVHYSRVVEIDPKRDAAWFKLGFKKHDGQWMTDQQVAARAEQEKADKEWAAKLKRWHGQIHGPRKKRPEEALAEFNKITEPDAVPSIYREFAGGGRLDQEIAVGLLGQVDSPVASKGLAMLAVYGKHPEVRRAATETLRGRPASEFLDLLVALMKDPIRCEVKPVGGPGSPGVLLIEGDRVNLQRVYTPPPPPGIELQLGDVMTYDEQGMPVVSRSSAVPTGTSKVGVKGSKSLVNETDSFAITTQSYSFGNALAEARKGAAYAQAQLATDLKRVEAMNDRRGQFNEQVMSIARWATGKNPGNLAKDWRDYLAGKDGRYANRPRKLRPKSTVEELVPLDYVPDFAAAFSTKGQTLSLTHVIVDS